MLNVLEASELLLGIWQISFPKTFLICSLQQFSTTMILRMIDESSV